MPIYSFICSKCWKHEERVLSMQKADKHQFCKHCGYLLQRDFQTDIPFASGDYKRAVHSNSLAIAPSQREEHLKTFPDIKLDSQDRPVFDNFSKHQAYLDKCNLVKERKKIKPKGVRIA